jgi:anti-anti-sigma factor
MVAALGRIDVHRSRSLRTEASVFDIRLDTGPGGEQIVELGGEVDMMVAGRLCEIVRMTAPRATSPWIVVDLARTTLVDSSAIKEMVDAHRLADSSGRILILRNATGVVADVLRVAGVADALGLPRTNRAGTLYGTPDDG